MFQVRLLGQFDLRADGKRVLVPSRSGQSLFAYLVLNTGTEHRREKLAGMIWPDVSDDVARKNLRQELWRIRKAITTQSPSDGDALYADELLVAFQAPPQFWLDVEQLERAPDEIDGLLNAISLYRGELLPGFYDEWVILERDRVQAIFEARCGLALEKLTQAQQWKQVNEWAERWIALGQTPEPAYRALMIAAAAQGDSAKLALAYERCAEALKNDVGVEPSGETRELFQQLSQGANASAQMLKPNAPVLIQPSGTVTFLFTDIEGSTKLLERLGNDYASLLGDQRDILRTIAEKFNGHEVDTQGDAFFFAFFRAGDAVNFAAEAQHALSAHKWTNGEHLRVRMGLHTGEPMLARTGYVGMDVHRAARIAAAGHGGQVLLSQTTSALVANELPSGTHLDDLGEHRLKDLRYPVHIIQLTIDDLPSDFPPLKAFDSAVEPPAPGEPPFKGLEFFDEADASLFFGREQLVEKLAQTIQAQHFLAVVIGASGSGKSSVVRAGLIPALKQKSEEGGARGESWHVFVMTPTAHPLEALATTLTRDSESVTATATLLDDLARDPRALQLYLRRQTGDDGRRSADTHCLLVVDQFEELFTLCHDDFEREQFIDCLLDAVQVTAGEGATRSQLLTLVLTIRADFYAHLAQYPELRDAVAKQQEYIGPMNTEELRRAMVEPATRGGWAFEPGLVDLILRDVGEEPGALPLLSHALLETWKRRSGHTMTLKGYADSGGVQGAISHTAETTYQQLTPEQQTIARSIFLRLTELGEGTEDTRRRADIAELEIGDATRAQVREVLTILADARLITTGAHTAEVAHEALIREWTRLREWLNEDRDGLKLHRNLTEAAREWELMERDAGVLYRGARLAQAQEFGETNGSALNAQERAFLDASVENEKRETREREEQQERELVAARTLVEMQTRAAKQLRRRAVFLAGAFVLALVLAGVALLFGDSANRNAVAAQQNAVQAETNANAADTARLNAEKEKRAATARELAAASVANLDVDPERSILLALQAIDTTRKVDGIITRESEEALHRAVETSRIWKRFPGSVDRSPSVALTTDGTRLAVNPRDGFIHVWELQSGKQLVALPVNKEWVDFAYFNKDGSQLATIDVIDDKTITPKIFDVHTGSILRATSLPITPQDWSLSAFNPDLSRVVVGMSGGKATVWDVETGKLLLTLSGHSDWVNAVAYSPDGTKIATSSDDKTAKIWDAVTGQELKTFLGHTSPVIRVTFNADGTRLGTGSTDGTARIWDTTTGKQLLSLNHGDWLTGIYFSHDGSRIFTHTLGRNGKVWDSNTGEELMTLTGHTGFIYGGAFTANGSLAVTSATDGSTRIWDLARAQESFSEPTSAKLSSSIGGGTVVFSPDGTRIAVSSSDGHFKIWNIVTGQEQTFEGHTDAVHRVAFSPDSKRIASASDDDTVRIWDVSTGRQLLVFRGHSSDAISVVFSPDGKRVASGAEEKLIQIWDANTGAVLNTLDTSAITNAPNNVAYGLAFSPDGSQLATSFGDGTIANWDLRSGKPLFSFDVGPTGAGVFSVAFSSDGSRLAYTTAVGVAKVLNPETGKEILSLGTESSYSNSISYSPDGKQIATDSLSGAHIWDASTGQEVLTLNGNPAGTNVVAFSPDGSSIALASDKDVRVYLLRIDDLMALAKTRVTRSLTQEECSKYLHVDVCPTE